MYRKLQALMKENQFYSALKTLEQLEHTYLPRVKGYMFSDLLAKEIPEMRKSIERKSKSELTVSAGAFSFDGAILLACLIMWCMGGRLWVFLWLTTFLVLLCNDALHALCLPDGVRLDLCLLPCYLNWCFSMAASTTLKQPLGPPTLCSLYLLSFWRVSKLLVEVCRPSLHGQMANNSDNCCCQLAVGWSYIFKMWFCSWGGGVELGEMSSLYCTSHTIIAEICMGRNLCGWR